MLSIQPCNLRLRVSSLHFVFTVMWPAFSAAVYAFVHPPLPTQRSHWAVMKTLFPSAA